MQIPLRKTFPRHYVVWCSEQHCTLIHSESGGNVCLLHLPYFYGMGYLARVPSLSYMVIVSTGPSFQCIVLESNQSMWFYFHSSFLSVLRFVFYRRHGTSIQCHSFLPSLSHNMRLLITVCPRRYPYMVLSYEPGMCDSRECFVLSQSIHRKQGIFRNFAQKSGGYRRNLPISHQIGTLENGSRLLQQWSWVIFIIHWTNYHITKSLYFFVVYFSSFMEI